MMTTSSELRHAGIGWPNGAVDRAKILALPSEHVLMLSTEGRYWHDEAVRAGKKITWRAVPRVGKRPAELKWSPSRFMAEALNLTDEPTQPIRDFVFGNELDLAPERGDNEDDWSNLENRYALIGGWAYSLIPMLRQALPGARLHWPAWTPDHQALDYAHFWRAAAELTDVLDFHAYDSFANIAAQYAFHRRAFPDKPLNLTEWHCKGDLEEERNVLAWMAETMAVDPMFEAAYFFIWRWHDHPGWWDDAWDLEHSPARLALFRDPPTAAIAEPPPVIEEPPSVTTIEQMPWGVDVASYQGDPDWTAVKAAGAAFAWEKSTQGVGYVNPRFARNWSAIKDAGLYRATYHFAESDQHEPEAEATFFVSMVQSRGLNDGDILALDLEDYQGSLMRTPNVAGWALRFLQEAERLAGFPPLLYVSPSVIAEYGLRDPAFARYLLWLAAWGSSFPVCPAPWSSQDIGILFWQYADNISVPGIDGLVDGDRFVLSADQIPRYGKPADAPAPPAPTDDLSELHARVAALEAQVGGLVTALAVVADDKADVIQKALDEIRGIREQFIGKRPAA